MNAPLWMPDWSRRIQLIGPWGLLLVLASCFAVSQIVLWAYVVSLDQRAILLLDAAFIADFYIPLIASTAVSAVLTQISLLFLRGIAVRLPLSILRYRAARKLRKLMFLGVWHRALLFACFFTTLYLEPLIVVAVLIFGWAVLAAQESRMKSKLRDLRETSAKLRSLEDLLGKNAGARNAELQSLQARAGELGARGASKIAIEEIRDLKSRLDKLRELANDETFHKEAIQTAKAARRTKRERERNSISSQATFIAAITVAAAIVGAARAERIKKQSFAVCFVSECETYSVVGSTRNLLIVYSVESGGLAGLPLSSVSSITPTAR